MGGYTEAYDVVTPALKASFNLLNNNDPPGPFGSVLPAGTNIIGGQLQTASGQIVGTPSDQLLQAVQKIVANNPGLTGNPYLSPSDIMGSGGGSGGPFPPINLTYNFPSPTIPSPMSLGNSGTEGQSSGGISSSYILIGLVAVAAVIIFMVMK